MIVTKVEPLSKTKYKIYLNHQFAFVLYKGELRSYKISDGRELSEEELDEIREKILLKRAKKRAMHLLEDMDRSEAGLRAISRRSDRGSGDVCEVFRISE